MQKNIIQFKIRVAILEHISLLIGSLMIIEDENLLTKNEKEEITTGILGNNFPFYWDDDQVLQDGKPFLFHTIIRRDNGELRSSVAPFFMKIVKRFALKHNLQCTHFYRGCINLTYPAPYHSTPHKDHDSSVYEIIIYLNKIKTGSTFLLKDKKIFKEIKPKQFKAVCFKGDFTHYYDYPQKGRRMVAVFSFN